MTQSKKVSSNIPPDNKSSQRGTPDGMRYSIAMGEVNGMNDSQRMSSCCGDMPLAITISEAISGMLMGSTNCCESVSLSVAEPTPAKREAYIR